MGLSVQERPKFHTQRGRLGLALEEIVANEIFLQESNKPGDFGQALSVSYSFGFTFSLG